MKPILLLLIAALALLAGQSAAHPGGQAEDANGLNTFMRSAKSSLSACSGAPHVDALERQALARRSAWFDHINHARGLRRRDLASVVAKSHLSNATGITNTTASSSILFNTTNICILEPKVTEGPYWVSGEVVRNDVRETQAGVDLYVDIQFVDVNTCEPVTGFYVDFWHANSTGVYSGVVASGNGNSADTTNSKKNFLRGIYPVGSDGVVQFVTKYPGHYAGRATHIHLIVNKNGTLYSGNNTYLSSGITHIGQMFLDDSLTTQVSALSPYSTNTQTRMYNAADMWIATAAASGFDPILNYVLLGSTVSDGIFSWIRIGVNSSLSYSASAVARYSGSSSGSSGSTASPSPSPHSSAAAAAAAAVGPVSALPLMVAIGAALAVLV